MAQSSTYKRDFRDPKCRADLWNFLYNRNQEISPEIKPQNDKRDNEKSVDHTKLMTTIKATCQDNKNVCGTKPSILKNTSDKAEAPRVEEV